MDATNSAMRKYLSFFVFAIWIFFYLVNIIIILGYRMRFFDDAAYILSSQLPTCFFYITVVYLGPTFSLIIFFTTNKIAPETNIGIHTITILAIISLITNVVYTFYVLHPAFNGIEAGNDIMDIFEEASTFAGYIIMILISPFISIVYSTNK